MAQSAFTGPLAGRIANPGRVRRRALNHTMLLHASDHIFNDRYREGWRMLLDSVRRRPLTILAWKQLLGLTARTILGHALWPHLLRILGKGPPRLTPINLKVA